MKRLSSLTIFLALLCGCAVVRTHQTEVASDGTMRTTTFKAITLFDSKNDLTKARTTMTDKSQGVAISGLEQTSEASNVVALTESVVRAAVGAAVKSVVP